MIAHKYRFAFISFMLLLLMLVVACGPVQESAASGSAENADNTDANTAETTTEDSATEGTTTENSAAEKSDQSSTQTTEGTSMKTDSGLEIIMIAEGDGPKPDVGSIVKVHYTGTLEDGTKFDSSVDRGEPIAFPLGQGKVIRGWDEGIALLNKGGKAKLIIPSELGYGAQGAGGGVIPPNATLIFEVELVDIVAGAPAAPQEVADGDYTETESGLKYYDFEEGDGATPTSGQTVEVHYTGWLTDGTKFDSSLDRGEPFTFPIGQGRVIRGWDEGVGSMKVGGKRQLLIPADLGYGAQGAGGGVIPPNAILIFEVELLGVR